MVTVPVRSLSGQHLRRHGDLVGLAVDRSLPQHIAAVVAHQTDQEGVRAVGAGAAHVFAIQRLPAPQLTILQCNGAGQGIGLIQQLVGRRHLLLEGGQVDMDQQPPPGGRTRDARTGRLQGAEQLSGMRIRPTHHRQHTGLPGGDGCRNERQQV